MKLLKLPHIGSRNIKTALSVFICLLFLNKSLMAAIAAIICMQSTIEDSVVIGINRLIGTFLGGLLGLVIIYFISIFNLQAYSIFISALSVSLVIYICNLIKKPAACVISSIVVLGIIIDPNIDNQFFYALNRTLETSLGVVIAILVNRFINPPDDSNLTLSNGIEEDIESLDSSVVNDIEEDIESLNSSVINEKDNIEHLATYKKEPTYTKDTK